MNWLCLPEHGGVGACQVSPVAWKLPALMGSEGYHYTPSQDSIQLGVSARAIAFHHLSLSCSVPFPQLYSSNNDPSTKSATLTSLASSVHPGSGWLPGYHSPPPFRSGCCLSTYSLSPSMKTSAGALSIHQRPPNPCKSLLTVALAPANHTAPPLRML